MVIMALAGVVLLLGQPEEKLFSGNLSEWWTILVTTKVVGVICVLLAVWLYNNFVKKEEIAEDDDLLE